MTYITWHHVARPDDVLWECSLCFTTVRTISRPEHRRWHTALEKLLTSERDQRVRLGSRK